VKRVVVFQERSRAAEVKVTEGRPRKRHPIGLAFRAMSRSGSRKGNVTFKYESGSEAAFSSHVAYRGSIRMCNYELAPLYRTDVGITSLLCGPDRPAYENVVPAKKPEYKHHLVSRIRSYILTCYCSNVDEESLVGILRPVIASSVGDAVKNRF
jgi:hypothetical protein